MKRIAIGKLVGRALSLYIQAPLLISRATFQADPIYDIPEITNWDLIKVSPSTGLIYPSSDFEVFTQQADGSIDNFNYLTDSVIDLVRQQYNKQVEYGIVLKGQYPARAEVI